MYCRQVTKARWEVGWVLGTKSEVNEENHEERMGNQFLTREPSSFLQQTSNNYHEALRTGEIR